MKTKSDKIVKYSVNFAALPALTPPQTDELVKLAALEDNEIDLSDMPEISLEKWMQAGRRDLYRPLKQPVTIRLDSDILNWFKQHAAQGGYQTEINRILRHHVMKVAKFHG